MAKILILGATGNIGGLVAKELLERKVSFAAGVRKPSEKVVEELKGQGVEIREFDLAKDTTWTVSLKGVDILFLLPPFQEDFAKPVKHVIDAAKKAGVKHIVKLSAIVAAVNHYDSKSSIHLGKEHEESDAYLKASGLSYTILQPTFFTSNILWQASSIAAQGAFYGSAGIGKSTYISPRDIARVAAHVITAPEKHKDQVYLLTGTEILSSNDIASILSLILRKNIKYVDLAPEAHKSYLLKNGAPAWQVDDIVGLEQIKKNEWTAEISSNVRKIIGSWPQTFWEWAEENKASFTLVVPPLSESAKKYAAGKLAVVTGANRGIGLAVVEALAKLSLRVILTARDEKAAEIAAKLKKEGLDVHFHALDTSSEASVAKFKEYLEKEHKGKVDILINNAGILASSLKVDFFNITPAEINKVYETNVLGTIRTLHAVVDLIKTHNSGSGRIVNISSVAGKLSFQTGYGFSYTNSKLSLNAATLSAAAAVRRDEKTKNVYIVALCPGPVETTLYHQAGLRAEDFGLKPLTTAQAAEEIVSLALSERIADFHGKFVQFGKELSYD